MSEFGEPNWRDNPRAAGPREFWLWKDDLDFDLGAKEIAASEFPHKDDIPKMLHVIEHSAYEALLAEARALGIEMNNFVNRKRPPTWVEILEIQAEFNAALERFRAFLAENKLDTTTKE